LRRIEIERRGDLLVELQLVRVEVQLGEQTVLVDQEIGDPDRREHVGLADLLDLLRTLQQEKELSRQRRVATIAVGALEERILVGTLEDQLARKALRETLREARLTDPDRPFDDDEARSVDRYDALAVAHDPVFRDPIGPDATLTD